MAPIEILKAIKEDIRDKFDADPLMMRTVNLVITEFEARTERLYKHNVMPSSLLAGKLALAARLVTTSNAKNLSQRIEQMESALDAYDNEILSLSNEA